MSVLDELAVIFNATTAPYLKGLEVMTAASEAMTVDITRDGATIMTATERMGLSMQAAGVAAEEAALKGRIAYDKLAMDAAKASASMEAAAARAAASNEALGASFATAEAGATKAAMAGAKRYAMAAAGAAIIAGVTVKMAADFESSTTRLVTSAGETQQGLHVVQQGILDMTGQVGNSAEELAKAMYIVESGGQHGAEGLKVLRAAAEGAAAEGADLYEVADAVTSILQDYHLKADDAAMVTSKMVAAVGAGKTTFQEFSQSLSAILPIASNAHISLDDISGALASMTVHGMSAQQASQNMADAVRHMVAPTQVQTKELAQLGVSSGDLANMLSEKGLTGTMQFLSQTIIDHMGPSGKVLLNALNQSKDAARDANIMIESMPKSIQGLARGFQNGSITLGEWRKDLKALPADQANLLQQFAALQNRASGFNDILKSGSPAAQSYQDALRRVTGDATGLNVALMLTGENTDYVNNAVSKVKNASTEAGNHVAGWAEIQETLNNKLHRAKAALGALGIEIGEKLLPPVSKFLGWLASGAEWLTKHHEIALMLAVALGGLALGFTIAAIAIWIMNSALLANPITWIILAIVVAAALLVYAVYELKKHWGAIWGWIKDVALDVWHWLVSVWNWIADAAKNIWQNYIVKPIKEAWNAVTGAIAAGVAWLQALPGRIWSAIKALPGMLESAASQGAHLFFYWIGWLVGTAVRTTAEMPGKVWNIITSLWATGVRLLKEGKDKALDTFKQLAVDAILAVQQWWRDTTTKIKTGISDAITWCKTMPPKVVAEMVRMRDEAVDKAAHMVTSIVSWLAGLPGKAVAEAKKLPGVIKNAVSDAGDWLYNAGQNIVNGAINGFRKKAQAMLDTVKGWGHDIVKGFNDAVGNRSPSKLFHQAAAFIVQGFSNGVDANSHLAVAAVQRMGRALMMDQALSVELGVNAADGVSAGALAGGWRPPAQRTDTERNVRIEVPVTLDGREIFRAVVPHAQQHKDRNNTTTLD